MKYARMERERRFLLAGVPASVGSPVRLIEDWYLDGTRLRLRVVREQGQDPVYKLGHKTRPDPLQPSTVAHTTLYLDRSEFGGCASMAMRCEISSSHVARGGPMVSPMSERPH